ncbi:MAG: EF-hand domain-containing protein, partial [Cyanobacteria bacterium]|nr:EF-hand domain-containing protein [Cyanobacteriota bacterium]
ATIRYMPEGKLNFNDAFGYAQRDLALIDKDKKGFVEPAQLTQFFAGGSKDEKVVKTATEMSDAYFKAIDTDGNKKITGDEMAAYIMFQDNPKDPLLQTLAAMGEDPKLKPTVAQYQKELTPLVANVDSTLDGQITPQERALAEGAVFAMPALTGRYLKEFSQVKFENKGNKTIQELYADFSNTPIPSAAKPEDK